MALLRRLTLRQQIAQLIMPWIPGTYAAFDDRALDKVRGWVDTLQVGGIIVSVGSPMDIAAKLNFLQRHSRLPLLIGADLEGGTAFRFNPGGTPFPTNMGVGAAGSERDAYMMGKITALEGRAAGIHMTFSPVADVNNNAANPIINTRSFGGDAHAVARFVAAAVKGTQDAGMLATAKHFPGHGDTDTDSHISLPVIRSNWTRLDTLELIPFRAAIAAGVDVVMSAHIAMPGLENGAMEPATLSPEILTGVLRDSLHFKGLVVTDALDMGALVSTYGPGEATVKAFLAGSDLLLMPSDPYAAVDAMVEAIRAKRVPRARLTASVTRMLEIKERLGLFAHRTVDLEKLGEVVGRRSSRDSAYAVSARSLVLVRDSLGLVDSLRAGAATRGRGELRRREYAAGGGRDAASRAGQARIPGERVPPDDGQRPRELRFRRRRAEGGAARPVRHLGAIRVGQGSHRHGRGDGEADSASAGPTAPPALGFPLDALSALPGPECSGLPAGLDRQPAHRRSGRGRAGRRRHYRTAPDRPATGISAGIRDREAAQVRGQVRCAATVAADCAATCSALPVTAPPPAVHRRSLRARPAGSAARFRRRGRCGAGRRGGGVLSRRGASTARTACALDDPRRPDRTTSIYDLASLTKVMATTTLAMLAVSEGRLDLDAPVQQYLPAFRGAGKDRVTIRHLLTHSSGLRADWPLWRVTPNADSALGLVNAMPLDTTPGARMVYSDMGAIVLGEVVERVLGGRLDRLAAHRIFEPLGMTSTRFRPPAAWLPRIAATEYDTAWRKRIVPGRSPRRESRLAGRQL